MNMGNWNNFISFAQGKDSKVWPPYDKSKSMALPFFIISSLTSSNIDKMEIVELWKPLVGFEGYYEISTLGRVKSIKRIVYNSKGKQRTVHEKIIKPLINRHGYSSVSLYKNGVKTNVKIHRMVALTFIPNIENKPFIDHINTIRHDNRLENLKWATRIENAHNPITQSKMIGRNHASGETIILARNNKKSYGAERAVLQISINGDIINEFKSIREAGREFNNSSGAISSCCRKKKNYKTVHGYIWRYKDEYEKLSE